ncbi:AMP-binding protein [Salipiger bermudensis]|uniref:AMP-binding protein n=1 Tax=Salipiger bermudensis TaxID=344736 RepID=UPI00300A6154
MKGRARFGEAASADWMPGPDQMDRSRLAAAMHRWGYDGLEDMHRASIDDPESFWPRALDDLGVTFTTPWSTFRDDSAGFAFPRWFTGGALNVATHCVTRHAEDPEAAKRPAVISEADSGVCRELSFGALGAEVERVAAGLAALGIGKGDRVGLFLPVIPEAAVALMACAKIGAVAVPAFSGYGPDPLAARLNAADAVALVTVDGTTRKGKPVAMKETADGALAQAPGVRHVLVIENTGSGCAMTEGRDHAWAEIGKACDPVPTVACDPNDPFMIIYTSGTTGAPKGIVHSHAGYLIKSGVDFGYAFDVQSDDLVGWIADMGWMLGPLMITGCLQFGAGIVFVEGLPNFPDHNRMWDIVERHRVTMLGMAPTAARGLRAAMGGGVPEQDISSLRAFTSTGEAWDEPTWWWLFRDVGGKKLPIINYTGGTETGGGILSNYTCAPISCATFAGPLPGQDADVLDAEGNPTDGIGELAVHNTWPGMTHAFWQDPERYFETYWSTFPDTWVHGDLASVAGDGYWRIHGRSDDTIKVSGRRIGPAEIESALVTNPEVSEAAVIGVPDPDRGSRIVAFVTLGNGVEALDMARAAEAVTRLVGKAMIPSLIVPVPGLPKTKNGKIMRRAIRARYLGQPAGDMSALDASTPLELIPVQADTEQTA